MQLKKQARETKIKKKTNTEINKKIKQIGEGYLDTNRPIEI